MRDDTLTRQLYNAETIIKDFKTKQDIAGDSWTVYRYQSPKTPYDIYHAGNTTSSTFVKRYKITYQIDGGVTIPNAFAIFEPKVDDLNGPFISSPFPGAPDQMYYTSRGFGWNLVDDGKNPLVCYLLIYAEWNWTADTNSWIGVRLRAISPYQGKFILEEIS